MKLINNTIFLLLMCTGCNLSPQGTGAITPTIAQAPVDVNTPTAEAAMSTYNNTAYGYSFQYPAGLAVEEASDSQYVWLDGQIYIYASAFNPEKVMGDAPLIETMQDTMIGQNTARRLSGTVGSVGGGIQQRYESFVIEHNKLYYQFTAYELTRTDVQPVSRSMNPVSSAAIGLLELVVTSLRFTN